MFIHIYIYIYIHTYIHIYVYVYTQVRSPAWCFWRQTIAFEQDHHLPRGRRCFPPKRWCRRPGFPPTIFPPKREEGAGAGGARRRRVVWCRVRWVCFFFSACCVMPSALGMFHVYLCMYVCMYVCVSMYTCVYFYVSVYICVYTYICMYVWIYV